jgi:hypothetical protein
MVEYWDRLKPLIDDKNWDITRLANELQVSYQAIKKVRDGGSLGSMNNLKAARIFKVNPDWLATGIGPKTPPSAITSQPEWEFETVDSARWTALSERQKGRVEKAINDELDAIERESIIRNATNS